MPKRNFVEEILSVRLRNRTTPRFGGALLRLLTLEVELQKASELSPEMLKYFPIALVATFESYFKSAVSELIAAGPPFSENAAKFEQEKRLPLDFVAILAIEG